MSLGHRPYHYSCVRTRDFREQIIQTDYARSDAEIRANAYKSLLLNLLSLTSIYAFDLLLLPLVQEQDNWIHHVGWFYQILWLLPVVGVSYYLNVSPTICRHFASERSADLEHMVYHNCKEGIHSSTRQ
jgi:hypothetical protein